MDTNFSAIREAISNDIYNMTLRVHLCDLLIEQGDLDGALSEIQDGLTIAPDDVALLGLAARVTGRLGHWQLAQRYERVLDAVIQAPPVPACPPVSKSARAEERVGRRSDANGAEADGAPDRSTGGETDTASADAANAPTGHNGSSNGANSNSTNLNGANSNGADTNGHGAAHPIYYRRHDDPKPRRRHDDPQPGDEPERPEPAAETGRRADDPLGPDGDMEHPSSEPREDRWNESEPSPIAAPNLADSVESNGVTESSDVNGGPVGSHPESSPGASWERPDRTAFTEPPDVAADAVVGARNESTPEPIDAALPAAEPIPVHDLRDQIVVLEPEVEVEADPKAERAMTERTLADFTAPDSDPDEVLSPSLAWDVVAPTGRRLIETLRSANTLDNVAGMAELVDDLWSFCDVPVRSPEHRRGGLLLWGPPGCGKAFLAHACAGSLQSRVVHVHMRDAVDTWIANGAHDIGALFAEAEANQPAVLFLDSIDALSDHQELLTHAVTELTARLDRLAESGADITVIASTEHPWLLNRDLTAARRFTTQLFVPPPDRAARAAIISRQLSDRAIEPVDPDLIAASTPAYTAADLVFVCELATEYAIFESIDSGQIRPITMEDLHRSIGEARPTGGGWFHLAREHAARPGHSDVVNYELMHRWLERAHLS
ncbi:MAG: AAA family ATPase [Actinomycetota bacterium]